MPKNKKPGDKPTPRKASAKKSPAKEAAPKKSAAEEIATKAPVTAPHLAAESIHLRTAQPSPAELYEEIRRRAYEFYRERGGQHGSHEADWHRAESEVRAKYKP
jgi:hypothetical protein